MLESSDRVGRPAAWNRADSLESWLAVITAAGGSTRGQVTAMDITKSTALLPGTLDLLILKAVSLDRLHGYGILLRIRQISGEALDVPQGSLYPALYRLEHQGLIEAEWGESENRRRAKYYRLTDAGRQRLEEAAAGWERLAAAMAAALHATPDQV